MDDLISRREAIDGLEGHYIERINLNDWQSGWNAAIDWMKDVYLDELPSAQPQYTELTPEEAASEIASGSIMSASYWLEAMIRLKQMGYAICRKENR